jgi:deoxyribodipyrimidine photolyase
MPGFAERQTELKQMALQEIEKALRPLKSRASALTGPALSWMRDLTFERDVRTIMEMHRKRLGVEQARKLAVQIARSNEGKEARVHKKAELKKRSELKKKRRRGTALNKGASTASAKSSPRVRFVSGGRVESKRRRF